MPHLQRDDATISYFSEGQGQPVLFIHGWACDSQDFIFQIPFFRSRGYRTIAFDARGHGRSSIPSVSNPGELRPEITADDAAALLRHLGITAETPALVVGHSLGCMVASLLSIRAPDLVRGLVLVDPMYYQTAEAHVGFMQVLAAEGAHALLARIFSTISVTEETPEWMKTWHRMRLYGTPEWVVYQTAYQKNEVEPAIGNWEVWQEVLARRTCPRLVVLKDELNLAKERGLGVRECDRLEVINGGHWLHVQAAGRFHEIVADWLTVTEGYV